MGQKQKPSTTPAAAYCRASLTLLNEFAGMASCALRKQQDAADDEHGEDDRSDRPTECKSTVVVWLIEKIADRRAKRPCQDERGPEQCHA